MTRAIIACMCRVCSRNAIVSTPVRLEVEGKPEKLLLAGLLKRLKLTKNQMYTYSAPINLGMGLRPGASRRCR